MKAIEVHCKGIPYGGMVWWKKVDEAARYLIYLYIAEKDVYNEIACVENDRQTLYHTFTDLALIDRMNDHIMRGNYVGNGQNRTNLEYFVQITAEDRNGNIIAESSHVKLEPLTVYGN